MHRYVLLGLPQDTDLRVFDQVKWSCASTSQSQLEQLENHGLSVIVADEIFHDVDDADDIRQLYHRIGSVSDGSRSGDRYNRTRSFLHNNKNFFLKNEG